MSFKDTLKRAIENFGGLSPDNLSTIAEAARDIAPDITVIYLNRLLSGQPPRGRDRLALEHALDVNLDEDSEEGNISRYARKLFGTKFRQDNFIKFVDSIASYRNKNLGEKELDILYNEYLNRTDLEIEAELFGLDL